MRCLIDDMNDRFTIDEHFVYYDAVVKDEIFLTNREFEMPRLRAISSAYLVAF